MSFSRLRSAQSLLEVAVIIALVALVVLAILGSVGISLTNVISQATCTLSGASNCSTFNQPSPSPVAGNNLILSPLSASPVAGASQSFSATEYGPNNSLLGDVTSSAIFTISPNGSCTASSCTATLAGLHTVTATYAGAVGHATLTFTHGPFASISLSPPVFSVTAGSSRTYTATGYDTFGNLTGDVTSFTTFSISSGGSCSANSCTSSTAGAYFVNGTASGHTSLVPATLNVTSSALASIAINPSTSSIPSGSSQNYTATGFDTGGNPTGDVTSTTTFNILPSGSCTLASCTASTAGAYTVTATKSTFSATATLTISPGAPNSIRLTPTPRTLSAGTPQAYVATAYDANDNSTGIVTSSTTFTISPDGSCNAALCTASTPGLHTVTGTDTGISGTASLTISAGGLDHFTLAPATASIIAGTSQTFSATAFDFYGNSLGDVTSSAIFTSTNGSCTASACTATLAGTTTIHASYSAHSASAVLTVTPGALSSLAASPAIASLPAGVSQTYAITSYDAYGNSLGDVTSSTSLTLAPDGSCVLAVCTATLVGDHTLTAAYSGLTATATLTITSSTVSSITLSPNPATITAGASQAFTVQGIDSFGNPAGDVTSFSTFVISSGSCTANSCTSTSVGSQTVTATYASHTATATLSITPGALGSISVTPAAAAIPAGDSQTFATTAYDAYGNSLGDVTSTATLTIGPNGSCTLSACTATAPGLHFVTAHYSSHTASASLTFTSGTIASIQIAPDAALLTAGSAQTYTATGYDSFGNSIGVVTAQTTFTINPDGTCTLNSCTASVVGTHTITANDSGYTALTTLNVLPSGPSAITLSPSSGSMPAGGNQDYTVAAFDQYGNPSGDVTASTSFSIVPNGSCTNASCTASSVGAHTVTGTYSGHTASATLTVASGTPDHILLTPSSSSISAGGTQSYSAAAYDSFNNLIGDVTSSTTFTILSDGSCALAVCTATATGVHTVTGTYSGHSSSVSLTVASGALSAITLTPSSTSITAGAAQTYIANGFDIFGNSLGDVTSTTTFALAPDGSCTASSCTATVAIAHTVTATNSTFSADATLLVAPAALDHIQVVPASSSILAGSTQTYTAVAYDRYNNSLGDVTSTTTFTIASGASCTLATCTSTIVATYTVTATHAGKAATSTLTVSPASLSSITIAPTSTTTGAGISQTYTATGYDSFGNSRGDVTASTTFTLAPDGSCTNASCSASLAGIHTVTANDAGYTATASLDVAAGSISSLSISPSSISIVAGSSQTYTATAYDSFGNAIADVTSSTTFALSPDGSCTAASCTATNASAHTVTATDAGFSATASLTITPAALDHLSLSPTSASVVAGTAQSYTALGLDIYNNSRGDVTAQTTFTVASGSCTLASCTATVVGAHVVTGADSSKTGTATLTITPAALNSITIAPTNTSIVAGTSQSYTTAGFDLYNNPLGDVTVATIFSIISDGSCTNASCTASTAGAHTVTATDAGHTATASLTITGSGLSSITITPTASTIAAGTSQTYTASGFDSFGNVLGNVTPASTFTVLPNGSCVLAVCTVTIAGAHTVTATDAGHTANATLTANAAALNSLTIAPSSASLVAGASQTYTASGFDSFNNPRGDITASTVFTVLPDGSCTNAVCTASTAGSHTVTGTSAGHSATASLTVTGATLSSITLSPSASSVLAGGSQAYTATAFDSFGNSLGDATAATALAVLPDGSCNNVAHTCTASLAGAHTVTATDAGHTANSSLAITPAALDHLILTPASSSITAGTTQTYTANGFDVFNNSKGDVTASTVFNIAPDGSCTTTSCTATLAGVHTVTGTDAGKTGTSTLTINAGALSSITIAPASASVPAGGSQAYTASGFDIFNNPLGSVTLATTFTITPDGSCTTSSCTASLAGSHTVTGTDSGHTATSTLTVTASALANITISPSISTIVANGSQAYTATSFDSFGNTIGSATAQTVFTISPNGSCTLAVCTATLAGAHTVTGTDASHTANATLTINAGLLASITLTPSSSSITAGTSQTYVANGFDAFTNPLGVVTAQTIFTITPDGSCTLAVCTATAATTHTVTGTNSTFTATSTLTINAGALSSITISPSSATVIAGGAQSYTANGFDFYGNPLGLVTVATTFSITPDGSCTNAVCTASLAGTHTVTGTDSGHTSAATLTVTASGLANITISPSASSIVANTSQTYTATAFDSFGNTIGDATAATVFTIAPNGSCTLAVCTATLASSHTVTGTDASHTATSTLTVTPGSLASITMSPTSATVTAGASQTYVTNGFDAFTNPLGVVTGATVFTITPNGSCTLASCTATLAGVHTVTATDTGHSATSTLTVNAGALSSITLAPSSTSINAGASQSYTASGFDSFSNPLGDVTGATVFTVLPDGSCTTSSCTASIAGAHTVTGTNTGHTATSSLTVNASALANITIAPASSSVVAGGSQTYSANGFDSFGNALGVVTGATVFSISPNGSCTATACTASITGNHTVTGTDSGHTATSTLTITPGVLASITLAPASSSIAAGTSQTYTATSFDSFGNNAGDVTATTVFTVLPNGSCTLAACTANLAGAHTVTGTNTGHTANATLTITAASLSSITIAPASSSIAAGTSQTYTATSFDSFGNTIGDATSSTTFAITPDGSCNNVAHTCTASTAGAHTITGTNAGHTATATLTITASGLSSITIAPSSTSITAGASQTYTATGFDSFGNSLGLVTGATTFAITPNGSCTLAVCTASIAGAHTVTGTDTGHTANATLTINAGPLSNITISPSASSITAGGSQTYTAASFDSFNNPLGDVTASTVFTVLPNGSCTLAVCTASSAGPHTVTATNTGHTATSTLTVNAAGLSSITIAPTSSSIVAGNTQAYTATSFDSFGNTIGDATAATVFTIAPNGSCTLAACTASTVGAHTVTGTDAGHTATASLSVIAAAPASITIAPASASATTGVAQTYTATGFDAFSNNLGDFTSSTTFTITPDGTCNGALCSATVVGTHTVTGTNAGHTANATLTVTVGALASIVVSPSSASIVAGGSQNYTANGFDAYGNALGLVTGATTFSITPDGSCTLASCTASVTGVHTVTGTNTGHTSTSSLTITVGAFANITIAPAPSSITAGGSQAYTATSYDSFGNTIGTVTGTTTFTILPDGSCTVATCTATVATVHTVTGTNTGHTATSTLTVNAAALDHLGLAPNATSITAGTAQAYVVTGFDVYNNSLGVVTPATTLAITPDGSCDNVAHTCTASVVGTHTVTGTDATKTGVATLTINAGVLANITIAPSSAAVTAGVAQNYTATGFDSFGNSLGSATASTVFALTPDGSCTLAACTATVAGAHTVTGTDAGHTSTATLTVNAAALNSITVAPSSSAITAGGSQSYTANGFDLYNNPLGLVTGATVFTITGASSTCTLASCTSTLAGSHTVTGTDSGHTANSTLTVNAAALSSITISPASSSITAGGSQVYTANGFDQYGNPLGLVTGATVFSVLPDGSCTVATCTVSIAGTHTVTGTDSGHTATSTLTVTAAALSSITISPSASTITANATQAYTATGFDAFGNTLGDATAATVFTIAPNGSCTLAVCTATLAGAHTVTGTDAGHTATSTLTVNAAALDHLGLTPASNSIVAGATQTYVATGFDVYNNSLGVVTGATVFTVPGGSCALAVCAPPSVVGAYTVTGTDASKTGTASLTVTVGALANITLSPSSSSITAGATQTYTSTAFDAFGNTIGSATGATVFSVPSGSCAAAVCTPSTTISTYTVTGNDAGHTATASLTVTAAALANITIAPASSSITAGTSQAYTATAFDSFGNTIGSATGATVFSVPSGSCVAAVCTPSTTVGTYTVTGTDSGHTATASLTVTAAALDHLGLAPSSTSITAGTNQTYVATGFDVYNNSLGVVTGATTFSIPGGSCTLAVCAPSTIAGTYTVTGTDATKTGTASLTVVAAALDHLVLAPASSSINAGATQTYTATGFDFYGNTLGLVTGATTFTVPGGSCTLAVCTPPTVASTYTVTGTDATKTGTASLTVTASALANITISPASSSIPAGTTQTYTATAFDSFGNAIGSATGATVFTVPSGSCVAAVCTPSTAAGTYTVTGTDAGHTATSSLTVTAAALDHLVLAPSAPSIVAGTSQTFTATGFDVYNNTKGDVTGATVFSVPSGSCVAAVCTPSTTVGTYTVTGTDASKTGTTSLTVTAAALNSITIAPVSASIVAGTSQTYVATGADVYNNTKGDVTGATIFTITPNGSCTLAVCTASAVGSHTIQGNNAGHTSTTTLTITAAALASITISPASQSIVAGTNSAAYTANGFDAFGNITSPSDVTSTTVFTVAGGSCTSGAAPTCTANAAGAHTVTGTNTGHTSTSTLTITFAALDHLGLTPASNSIAAGTSQTYVANGFDVYNNPTGVVTGATTFSVPGGSCALAVCTPSTALSTYTVTGTDAGKTGTASLTVTPGPVFALTIAPASASITADVTQTYSATALDQYGNAIGTVTGSTVFTITGSGTCVVAACGSHTPAVYTVTGTNNTKTSTASLTVTIGTLASITISPLTSIVRTGTAVTYTATGFDQYSNNLGNVTAGTTFTDNAVACAGAVCTNGADGAKTILATNAGHTASTTQTSTTCTITNTTASSPGGAKENTAVTFTANGGACTGVGQTPQYYFYDPAIGGSGWQASNTFTFNQASPGTEAMITYVEVNTGAGAWAITGGQYGFNYDWTTCSLTNVTLPAGVGVGPRAPGPTSTWTVTATGSCTGGVAPSYDYLIEDGAFAGHLDSGQLGNTTTWQWNTATYPGATSAADGNTKVVVAIMSNNERLAHNYTTFIYPGATSFSPGYYFWNGGANFLFASCTANSFTASPVSPYKPDGTDNQTVTQVGTCSAGATPTYEITFPAAAQAGSTCDTVFATTCNTSALISFNGTSGAQTLSGLVVPLGDEAHMSVADANGGIGGFTVTKAYTITANCWGLSITTAAGNGDGNGSVSISASETCNPGTTKAFTYWYGEECVGPCPPPHCYTTATGSGGPTAWNDGRPSSGFIGCWPKGLSTTATSWAFDQQTIYTSCYVGATGYNNPYSFLVVQNNYNSGVYLYSGIWKVTTNCLTSAQTVPVPW